MEKDFIYDVFLSYSSKDKPMIRKLASMLTQEGVSVWFDENIIKPGDDIFHQVASGLETSYILLLCMTTNTFGSDWISLERNTMLFVNPLNRDRRFVPLLLNDCEVPATIRRYKHIDARKLDMKAIKAIVECLPERSEKRVDTQQVIIDKLKREVAPELDEFKLIHGNSRSVDIVDPKFKRKMGVFDKILHLGQAYQADNISANLLYIDLDGFTLLNIKYGKKIGNRVISTVLRLLKETLTSGYVTRWGADEYFCCFANSSEKQSFDLAENILSRIRGYEWQELSPELFVTASIGVASFKRKANERPIEWMERAMIGAAYAKKLGGNIAKRGPEIPPAIVKRISTDDSYYSAIHLSERSSP